MKGDIRWRIADVARSRSLLAEMLAGAQESASLDPSEDHSFLAVIKPIPEGLLSESRAARHL
jgi:hypothetical protein